MYDIQSKSDFNVGATLTVKIPQDEVDKKSLYTILADRPDFVLPFFHKIIDGKIEFTYQIGNRSKLAYISGNKNPHEYAELWHGVLHPLLNCENWFMKPYSFVLQSNYIYCDRNGRVFSYVYIPSVKDCSDYQTLQKMATDVAKLNHVTDISLENRAIWALQNFNPSEFMLMISPYRLGAGGTHNPEQDSQIPPSSSQEPYQILDLPKQVTKPEQPPQKLPPPEQQPVYIEKAEPKTPVGALKMSDDIAISLPPNGKMPKEDKPKKVKKDKEPRQKDKPKDAPIAKPKGSIWGKKNPPQQDIIQGAAIDDMRVMQGAPQLYPPSLTPQPVPHAYPQSLPLYPPQVSADEDNAFTQIEYHETDAPKFRYIGSGDHPRVIEVLTQDGGLFTIGRFDVSVGVQQSNFEFDKKTKAVSRRHAAIERNAEGHFIVDLDSSGGTYINGQKLPPNAPFRLDKGSRVSFGHSGVDYIWDE